MKKTTQKQFNEELKAIQRKAELGFITLPECARQMIFALERASSQYYCYDDMDDEFNYMKSFHHMAGILYDLSKE